ncbi:MAG: O-antigen ligase family protein [Bacteroidales bacterium]|nr:O-antigen ligase family protein [Bacteroidales bacterium]
MAKRSKYNISGADKKGQPIRYTIVRYLTSKGLRKDSVGVWQLTYKDIANIEEGNANYLFASDINFYGRIYQTIWEIDLYLKDGNPQSHSVAQRLEFLKAAMHIVAKHPVIGVGTGDLPSQYKQAYKEINSKLEFKLRYRAHNQYVTIMVTFGAIGFLYLMFAMFYAWGKQLKSQGFFMVLYGTVVFMSMLNEDTLETQAGVTLFTYFFLVFSQFHPKKI